MQPLTIDAKPGCLAPPPALPRRATLFLDFDGTLVELAAEPDAVTVDDRLRSLLRMLADRLDGRLAIITGRSIETIRGFLGDAATSVGGSHGIEIEWADGRRHALPRPAWLDDATAEFERFAADLPGVLVEVKPFGVALHYRRAPDAEAACTALAERIAATGEVHLQRGKMMVELRAAGADKGDAVRAFMADPSMADSTPLFLGDDLTDEAGFEAAAALGGAGILVGDPRETAATYRLADVAATLDWLERMAEARA